MDSELPEEEFLDFKCPYCDALNSFPSSAAGLPRQCMNCIEAFIVPPAGEQMAKKVPLPIETEKFRLRLFGPEDWEDLLEFQCQDESEATSWLQQVSQVRFGEVRQPFELAIALSGTGKVIGSVELMFTDSAMNQMQISLSLNQTATPKGLDQEVLEALLDFCFQELNLHRVIAECGAQDVDTPRLYDQVGMRKEAEFVKSQYFNGEWLSTSWYAILQEEYFAETPAGDAKAS